MIIALQIKMTETGGKERIGIETEIEIGIEIVVKTEEMIKTDQRGEEVVEGVIGNGKKHQDSEMNQALQTSESKVHLIIYSS